MVSTTNCLSSTAAVGLQMTPHLGRVFEYEMDVSQMPFTPTYTEPWALRIRDPIGAAVTTLFDTQCSGIVYVVLRCLACERMHV